jgi:hypothetical protein
MVARRTSTEIPARHKEHSDLYWFGPPESKTLRLVWYWDYVESHLPQGRRPRPRYIGRRPWATSRFPSILVGYNVESLSELVCLVLYSKLSSCPWDHMSGRAGPMDRSAGLLVGWAACRGRLRPWSVGTHGYPCLSIMFTRFDSRISLHSV